MTTAKLKLTDLDERLRVLSLLVGQPLLLACLREGGSPCSCPNCVARGHLEKLRSPWTHAKVNRALLLAQQRVVTPDFFEAFWSESASDTEFLRGLAQFRAYALLRYANIRHAFTTLAGMSLPEIRSVLGSLARPERDLLREYQRRQHSGDLRTPLDVRKLWLLGYISGGMIGRDMAMEKALRLELFKQDTITDEDRVIVSEAQNQLRGLDLSRWTLQQLDKRRADLTALKQDQEHLQRTGTANSSAYATAAHIDVYVATSMRDSWEYEDTAAVVAAVFADPELVGLNLTQFDPTQSSTEFDSQRLHKGLIEGLMLARADATIYMVAEVDTIGKDSELASTLAQGKPVIAYVPRHNLSDLEKQLEAGPLERVFKRMLMLLADNKFAENELKALRDGLACYFNWRREVLFRVHWQDEERAFRAKYAPVLGPLHTAVARAEIRALNRRADTLTASHPLALQLEQGTGVACGILVARSTERVAKLLRQVLTNRLEFAIKEEQNLGTILYEVGDPTTPVPYRLAVDDPVLSNAFWRLYPKRSES